MNIRQKYKITSWDYSLGCVTVFVGYYFGYCFSYKYWTFVTGFPKEPMIIYLSPYRYFNGYKHVFMQPIQIDSIIKIEKLPMI